MRSLIAALRTLVLPAGATSGPRIVLDGITGQILAYDANGDLRFRLRANTFGVALLEFPTGDVDEINHAAISTQAFGSGATRRLLMDLTSGQFGSAGQARLELRSESQDSSSEPAEIRFVPLSGAPLRLAVKDGAPHPVGVATLVAGTVAVSHPWVTANTRVILTRQAAGGTPGHLSVARVPGASFTINSSSGADTSTVAWLLIEPI